MSTKYIASDVQHDEAEKMRMQLRNLTSDGTLKVPYCSKVLLAALQLSSSAVSTTFLHKRNLSAAAEMSIGDTNWSR